MGNKTFGKTTEEWGNFFIRRMTRRMNITWAWAYENKTDDVSKCPFIKNPLLTLEDARKFIGDYTVTWADIKEQVDGACKEEAEYDE